MCIHICVYVYVYVCMCECVYVYINFTKRFIIDLNIKVNFINV